MFEKARASERRREHGSLPGLGRGGKMHGARLRRGCRVELRERRERSKGRRFFLRSSQAMRRRFYRFGGSGGRLAKSAVLRCSLSSHFKSVAFSSDPSLTWNRGLAATQQLKPAPTDI